MISISLLHIDPEILKNNLPSLISPNKIAYVKNKCLSESGRQISDTDESECLNIEGYLVTTDIRKAFESVNHFFLLAVLKASAFVNNFLHWIEILLTNQESCVLNGSTTAKYFMLKKETRQGDLMSAYFFILALEIAFLMIQTNQNVKPLDNFNYDFLYTAYTDDTTFFIRNAICVIDLLNVFDIFFVISG